MPPTPPAGDAQEAAGSTTEGEGTNTPTPETDGTTPPQEGGQEQLTDPEALAAELARVRREAASYRTRLRDHETEAEQRRQAELSELEREREQREQLQSELDQLRTQAQEAELRDTVTRQASQLGFRNPTLAHQLIDSSQVEYDDDGNATNVEALLRDRLQSDPYLASSTPGDGGAGRNGAGAPTGGDMNDRIRAGLNRG